MGDDHNKCSPPKEKEHVSVKETLPFIFQFKDEKTILHIKKNEKRKLNIVLLKWTYVSWNHIFAYESINFVDAK
ncbi:hypothetical protein RDI58_000964 [Solanum bulbocastanum]|uniref:Uncharacterized protein n=1 Tax=Solanum bulbocastanum TaxID=147425 RepID=A0AAN8UB31_SOLBU